MIIDRVKKKEGPRKWMTESQMRSIPEYVIKKGRPHGHRHGKHPGNREYYLANDLKKRFIKRDYKGIHDRFLRDHIFRGRMIENSRDEEICRAWDGTCRTKSHLSNVRIRILSLQVGGSFSTSRVQTPYH